MLFATTTILALLLGLLAVHWARDWGMTVTFPRTTYMLPPRTICFGVALVFCCFAFLYSLWMIPWSTRAAAWHLVMSLVFTALWGAGWITFARVVVRDQLPSGPLPLLTQVVLASWILVPFLFMGLQAWFLADALRRCWLLLARR